MTDEPRKPLVWEMYKRIHDSGHKFKTPNRPLFLPHDFKHHISIKGGGFYYSGIINIV